MMSNRDYIKNALLDGPKCLTDLTAWCQAHGAPEELDVEHAGDILNTLKLQRQVNTSEEDYNLWQATDQMVDPRQRIIGGKESITGKWDRLILPSSILAPGAYFDCELPEKAMASDVRRTLARRNETKDSSWRVEVLDDGKVRITKAPNAPSKPNGVVELADEKKEHHDVLKANPEPSVDPILPPDWGSLEFNIGSLESKIKIIDAELAEPEVEAKEESEPPIAEVVIGEASTVPEASRFEYQDDPPDMMPASEMKRFVKASLSFFGGSSRRDDSVEMDHYRDDLCEELNELSDKIWAWREAWELSIKVAHEWMECDESLADELASIIQVQVRDKILLRNRLRMYVAKDAEQPDEYTTRLISGMEF